VSARLACSGAGLVTCVCVLAACSAPAPAPASAPTPAVAPAGPDPYHPPPRDTVDAETYNGWKQYSLHCARCHGDDALGTTFGPDLVTSLGPTGEISSRDSFLEVLRNGRHDKGMPSAAKMGLDSVYFDGLYRYLAGRGSGVLKGGRPARLEQAAPQ
jgi:mono/diheme cytochrome c family protein